MAASLKSLATVIRSKNAKPFYITFDILFDDQGAFERVVRSGAVTPLSIGRLYQVPEQTVRVIEYPAARAIKITLDRWVPAASFEDTDLMGSQQAVPLYDLVIQ